MSKNQSIRPEDILPDGVDSTSINGITVRKASMAAFLANIEILENANVTEKQKQDALNTMKELAVSLKAIGLHKHVTFNNPMVEQIFVDVE